MRHHHGWRRGRNGHLHRRRGGPLFWRVYLHGIALLLLVAIAVGGVGWAFRKSAGWPGSDAAARYAADKLEELRRDPARLEAELERVREAFGVRVTVWDADGRLLASSADPPLARELAGTPSPSSPARLRGPVFGWAFALRGGGVLVAASEHGGPDPVRGLIVIGAVLLALAVGSIPLARSIAAPLERLTDAARRLGAGDLSARAGVRGRGEVGELGRTFDEMAARLERLVRTEQELLANVSHELRTPMARIRVALELAAEGDLDKARRHLAGIGADLGELDRLVEDVIAAAKLDLAAGGGTAWPVAREAVDLAAVARDAADRWREQHPDRVVELAVEGAVSGVSGDAALLRRLVANLLDNAGKYSEPPGPITIRVHAAGGDAVLEVRDRGIGIDPADLPRLFTPFFRTDRSRERGTGGTGLGLALVKRIAEAHGGEVAVESQVGQGTAVRVRLPPRAEARAAGPAFAPAR
jgi:signal transduction histidine kinase